MAQTFEFKDEIASPAETVMKWLLDPKFIEEWTVIQKGVSPRATLTEKAPGNSLMTVNLEEPLPIGTVKTRYEFSWDVRAMRSSWTRTAEGMAGKANIRGITEIIPNGADKCYLVDKINIDIPIPIMGKKMEQMVAQYLQDGRKEKMDYFRK